MIVFLLSVLAYMQFMVAEQQFSYYYFFLRYQLGITQYSYKYLGGGADEEENKGAMIIFLVVSD